MAANFSSSSPSPSYNMSSMITRGAPLDIEHFNSSSKESSSPSSSSSLTDRFLLHQSGQKEASSSEDDWYNLHLSSGHSSMMPPVFEQLLDEPQKVLDDDAPDMIVAASLVSNSVMTIRYWEADATWVIIVVIFPIMLLVGTIGNVLTYIVLHRKAFTDRTATSWLFRCLALMCTVCLWVGLPRHWLRTAFGVDIRQIHFLICQFHRFILYCAMDITTWIFVSISADRLVAVLVPFRAHTISTPRNARRVFIGLSIFFALFNAEVFITYGRRYATTTESRQENATSEVETTIIISECQERDIPQVLFYNRVIHPMISFAMYVIGPFCFMLASSIVIARKLAQRRKFLQKSTTSHLLASNQESSKPMNEAAGRAAMADVTQRSTTMLMFVASLEFLLTATPAFFLDIAEKTLKQSDFFSSPRGVAQFQLLYTVVRLLLFSNFALHFFLFCLSAHRFRREVWKVLICWHHRQGSLRRSSPQKLATTTLRIGLPNSSSISSDILQPLPPSPSRSNRRLQLQAILQWLLARFSKMGPANSHSTSFLIDHDYGDGLNSGGAAFFGSGPAFADYQFIDDI